MADAIERGVDLTGMIRFDTEGGRITLKAERMVMFSCRSLGALRKELIETLGWEQARGVLKRFGFASGLADGAALLKQFPDASGDRHMDYGPALHALEGVAKVVRIPERSTIDLQKGIYHVEAYWENSYEADQHLELFGQSDEPVCATLAGYATGHSSNAAGRRTMAVELECKAMGHDRCRFMVDFEEHFDETHDRERHDYEVLCLPEVLHEMQETIERQRSTLHEKEEAIALLQSGLKQTTMPGLLGSSPALADAVEVAELAAPVDTTVLILGESGTGKEMIARGVHARSARAEGPFIAVNCSAIPESLQEAEFFGYAKGAFTGALGERAGVFEEASGGTLFLDEIGDLALTAQTKLLRVLQEEEVVRIGENHPRAVDVRIVAATNRDLESMVAAGSFREDLYYRINVVAVSLPPLRDRGDDVLLLAEHFVREYAHKFNRSVTSLTSAARRALAAYAWPGNVRELMHAVERGVILAPGDTVDAAHLPARVIEGTIAISPRPPAVADSLAGIKDEAERLTRALELAEGNKAKAARLLGISRTTLWRKMRNLDIGQD